jgi:hypothetical protein
MRMTVHPSENKTDVDWCAANGTGQAGFLRGGWSSCGNSPNGGARRQAGVAGLRCGCYQCKSRSVSRRNRTVNRLVTQVADGAGCFGGAIMMMPDDASERHADQQQHQQRYRDHQIPCWTLA